MKRNILTAMVSLLVLAFYSQASFAGEWNKPRGYIHGTADDPLPANSACAFSGLDEPNDLDPQGNNDNALWGSTPAGGIVQAYGQIVAAGLKEAFPAPGVACKGN